MERLAARPRGGGGPRLSTTLSSGVLETALAVARARGCLTIAFADAEADTPSEHIPRIQEAQASAYHLLRELVA